MIKKYFFTLPNTPDSRLLQHAWVRAGELFYPPPMRRPRFHRGKDTWYATTHVLLLSFQDLWKEWGDSDLHIFTELLVAPHADGVFVQIKHTFYIYAMCLTSLADSFDDRTVSMPF